MSRKKDKNNEEMFEDCPFAVQEYESEIGVNNFKRKPYSEFFVASQNNYGTYSELSRVKKVFINIKK